MFLRTAPWIAFGCSVAVLAVVLALWFGVPTTTDQPDPGNADDDAPLIVLTAAALRPAMEPAAAEYRREYGVPIEVRYNSSEVLLTNLRVTGQGDVFIPADDSYVAAVRADGLLADDYDLAGMTGVAVIRKDHPKAAGQITWDDFLSLRIAQPNVESTAVGKITKQRLTESGQWPRIERARPVSMGTVTEAANAVHVGSADAAIVWDAIAQAYKDLKAVRLPGLERVTARVTAAVCKKAQSSTQARLFAQYLADEETGQKHFRAAGYAKPVPPPKAKTEVPNGDRELILYAGAMLRPAIEETIKEFEAREGARVTRVYNGCGILVTQMRADKVPDLYLACDPRFMGDVADLFERSEVVSNNQLVIAVPKGNPAGLKELKDLGKEGLRVGVGHEQQCALGAITKETFIQSGVYAAVRKNVRVESPTGDLLVNQLRTGALDAVVCYVSNVVPNRDKLDSVPVTGIPCANPEQPAAVARGSTNPALAAKLIAALKSAESRRRFEEAGFGWGKPGSKK